MEKRISKSLMGIAIAVMILCAIQIVWIIVQSWFVSGINGSTGEINWNEAVLPFQLTIFCGRLLFAVCYFALIILFLIKTLKALNDGTLFPKSNVKVLYATAVCHLISKLCDDNMGNILLSETPTQTYFAIESSSIIITLLFIIFAMIYKIAAKVSEENNLTI